MYDGIDLTKEYFKYSYNRPSTFAFHALVLSYFVKEVLNKRSDKKSTQLYFRLFRTGLLGDILYKAGHRQLDDDAHDANHEILAGLFEAYLMLSRSIYDYLLTFLKEKYGIKETSYMAFLKKIKKGDYEEINKKFREHLDTSLFTNFRSLRNSVAHKTPNLMIYVKDRLYWVDGTLYKDDGTQEHLDWPLQVLIFEYTASLMLLMAYIAECITGKSLLEQIREAKLEEGEKPSGV